MHDLGKPFLHALDMVQGGSKGLRKTFPPDITLYPFFLHGAVSLKQFPLALKKCYSPIKGQPGCIKNNQKYSKM